MSVKLSILTVVKDDLPGFNRTLDSIVPQLESEVEWLIVDGSTGNAIEDSIRAQTPSNNVRLLRHPPQGIYDAMNFALANTMGNWCWFINAGDVLLRNDSVERALKLIVGATTEGLIGTPVIYLTGRGFVFSVVEPSLHGLTRGNIHHQGAIFRTSVLNDFGGFRTDLKLTADGELLDRLMPRISVRIDDFPLVGFFMGGASTRNFTLALRETNSFREGFYTRGDILNLSLRNYFVKLLLEFESHKYLSWLVVPLLRRRERELRNRKNIDFLNYST